MTGTSTKTIAQKKVPNGLLPILKANFISPIQTSWSYTLFILSLGVTMGLIACGIMQFTNYSRTSIISYALMMPIYAVFAFLLPSFIVERQYNADIIGEFTGLGPIMMAFISGVPLSFVFTVIHNICSYYHLWSGKVTTFPMFFYYYEDTSYLAYAIEIISGTVIPTLALALFLYGVMWKHLVGKPFIFMAILTSIPFAMVQFNPVDFFAFLLVGAWYAVLRDRTGNIWGIVCCAIGTKLTYIATSSFIQEIDIYSTSTLSDIDSTFLYSSVPALFFGVILLLLIRRYLNVFKEQYFSSTMADNIDIKNQELNPVLPSTPWYTYVPALITGLSILTVLWFLLFKGVFL